MNSEREAERKKKRITSSEDKIGKMKNRKVLVLDRITCEMLKEGSYKMVCTDCECYVWTGKIPKDWQRVIIVLCYQGKGDKQEWQGYRWSKRADHP